MLFPDNIGAQVSIDEVAVTNGELWTVVTNKEKHGRKGALMAMIKGTKAADIAKVLLKMPAEKRNTVTETTMDMAENMEAAVRASFPRTKIVTDRFHVQQLVSDAAQEIRIELRRAVTKEENEAIKKARAEGKEYRPTVFENGDTKKQLPSECAVISCSSRQASGTSNRKSDPSSSSWNIRSSRLPTGCR